MPAERMPHVSDIQVYEDRLEELVDNRNISYEMAMNILGSPPYELYYENRQDEIAASQAVSILATHVTSNRKGRRSTAVYMGPQRGEEERLIVNPDEIMEPPYYQQYRPLTNEQIERNREGLRLVRRALRASD